MRLLLDTHTFLWFIGDQTALSPTVLALIQDPDNEIWLSLVSAWELGIKSSSGKLQLTQPIEAFVQEHAHRNNFVLLSISLRHIALIERMPFHHRDPFDRLLVAQSLVENLPLVSIDGMLDAYGIQRIW